MKILKIKASGYKNCENDITIDFIPRSKKTIEDKAYELQEIAPELYIYKTTAIVGKNASGKTSIIELIAYCYSICSDFRLENKNFDYDGVSLEIIFFHENNIYKYQTKLIQNPTLDKADFSEQKVYKKKYFKSKVNSIFDSQGFVEEKFESLLPEDTSIVFFVLKKKTTLGMYFDSFGSGSETYDKLFKLMNKYDIEISTFNQIINLFDDNITKLEKLDDHNFSLRYKGEEQIWADKELLSRLSSGTTKGILLYITAIASLKYGFDILIDEIENHFHKTLVENLISLYKDNNTNKYNASLIFTTHYCELLDLFNRTDNIWISKSEDKIQLYNMYTSFPDRFDLLKSKKFYSNAFGTGVNYEKLMGLKKVLMK